MIPMNAMVRGSSISLAALIPKNLNAGCIFSCEKIHSGEVSAAIKGAIAPMLATSENAATIINARTATSCIFRFAVICFQSRRNSMLAFLFFKLLLIINFIYHN